MGMIKFLLFVAVLVIAGTIAYQLYLNSPYGKGYKRVPGFGKEQSMIIKSNFNDGEAIPSKYTCDGADVNPPFNIFSVPVNSKSLFLSIEDPDSAVPNFTHWLIFNIDPSINGIAENSVPDGAVEGLNDFGAIGYGGPCPNAGTHHYVFKMYSLDIALSLKNGAKKSEIMQAIKGHILEETQMIGTYKRS